MDRALSATAASLALFGLVVSTAFALEPGVVRRLAFRAPTMRASIETAITVAAISGATVFAFSLARTRRVRDAVLFAALLEGALVELISYRVMPPLSGRRGDFLAASVPTGMAMVAAALAIASVVSPDRRLAPDRNFVVRQAAGGGILAAIAAELVALLTPAQLVASSSNPPHVPYAAALRPLGIGVTLATASVLAVAAVEVRRRTRSGKGASEALLTGGFVLLYAAAISMLALPPLARDYFGPREVLQLGGYLLIALAGLRQETALRRSAQNRAAIEARHHMARELHDGLAQDLAFIAAHGTRLGAGRAEDQPLESAARHALEVSRNAISELSSASEANENAR
jgi:signal transduction histidine kinase